MADEPFTVLLPVYRGDRPEHVRRAFDSCTREQHLAPDSVVVVQDGPVPGELASVLDEVVAASPVPTELVALERNVGLARALDAGLRRCPSPIVARVDADDISLPTRFARQVPLVRGGLDLVGSAIAEFVDDEAVTGLVRVPPVGAERIARYARFHDPFNHPSVVYRKSAVEAAGGYRDLARLEDYWLFTRMIGAGARVDNVAEPLVLYRVGAGAYARRGGLDLLRSEIVLQARLRHEGFTTPWQCARNLAVRGAYRLVPEALRRRAYRTFRSRDRRGLA